MITANNLTKRYEDNVLALDAVSFQVERGEIYCLLGANGAGKTTALNLFLDFIKPSSGQALINGVEVAKNPLEAKKYVSFGSEEITLYGHMTARENLDFFSQLSGKRRFNKDDYYMVLREVGLPESAFEKKLRSFSKGLQQKVSLAISIIRDTPAILLDEPTAGLDLKAGAELTETLRRLRAQKKAILISTHDLFRVREIADRVGIIKEGRKVLERTSEELEREDLQALYLDYMRGSRQIKGGSYGS
jgi:ABC-2 type transport system ATP-binding protein